MADKQTMVIRLGRVLRYNRNRIERALSLFDTKTRPLFHCLPFLLQVNHPEFPGYVDDPQLPFGLLFYSYNRDIQVALLQVFPKQHELIGNPQSFWPDDAEIISLSLMGSIGTMAQSDKSDMDYWVCIDGNTMAAARRNLLQQKLMGIEQWAWDNYHLEVHFFLSDINKIRHNDFGQTDGESAGSALPLFLKNEYYATHINIAGKMPFWWLTPADCSDEVYTKTYHQFIQQTDPDPKYFMDLGNLSRLSVNEMFGASLWQLAKAMDSPFKSVLKMAKLEVFTDNTDRRIPLCNVLKERVHNSEQLDRNVRETDPYALMFDTILKFYQLKNPKFIELFKTCLYIKSDCPLTRFNENEQKSFKYELVRNYVQAWQWKHSKIEMYDKVQQWPYHKVAKLGRVIHSFLIGCYRRLSTTLRGCPQLVGGEDMTVIGRKIEAFYQTKPGKIQYLKRAFEEGLMQTDITITMELDLNFDTKQRWSAFRGRQHYRDTMVSNPCLLKQSSDPVDLLLWCLFNRICNSNTQFHLLQNQLPVTNADIKELLEGALQHFQPIRVSELARHPLLAANQISHCLVVVNFASHSNTTELETVRVIYLTSWGEVFSVEAIDAFKQLEQKFSQQAQLPICQLFTPQSNDREVLYPLVESMTGYQFDKFGESTATVITAPASALKKSSCPWLDN